MNNRGQKPTITLNYYYLNQFQYPCPEGTYSPFTDNKDITQCIVCPAGHYCLTGSATPSGLCSSGSFCPQGSKNSTSQPCPGGTYQPFEGARSIGECLICPLGSYCSKNSSSPVQCPKGTIGDFAGLEYSLNSTQGWGCSICPAGYYCPILGMIDPFPCGTGKYSQPGALSCDTCNFDHYCANLTTTYDEMIASKCDFGFNCTEGTSVKPFNPDYSCKAGYYCQKSVQYPCPQGTYNPVIGAANSSYCLETPAGYYSDKEASTQYKTNICPEGYFCPKGSISGKDYQCPEGSYRNIQGATSASDCGTCPTGHYCPTESREVFVCPQGYYCPQSSVYAIPCPVGTFGASKGLREESECTPCYAGRYCSQKGLSEPDGLCDAGYYCISGAYTATPTDNITGNVCPAGGYCGLGSKKPSFCEPGKYNPSIGKSVKSDCKQCDPGYYCSGSSSSTPTGKCQAGYYCPSGSKFPTEQIALEGYNTSAGASIQKECPAGTYNPKQGQSSCQSCPAGYLCSTKGLSTPTDCGYGNYCIQGSSSVEQCTKGTYNDELNAKSVADCKACPPGQYCFFLGSSKPTGNCSQGYYCKTEAISDSPADDPNGKYGICPQGYYCPKATGAPIPCPSGTYGEFKGLNNKDQCTDCPLGKYCQSGGLKEAEGDCEPGYFCNATRTKLSRPNNTFCLEGEYCEKGFIAPKNCPAGTYQNQNKSDVCHPCPKGYYCPEKTSDFRNYTCPKGYYCPLSTGDYKDHPCPIGSYNPQIKRSSLADCIPCDPGKVCLNDTAQTEPNVSCPAGQYCTLGAPNVTVDPSLNITLRYNKSGDTCKVGYYCPQGSSFQLPCSPGYYCGTTGLSTPTGQCDAGYYCVGGASKKNPTILSTDKGAICPAGYYCPLGSSSPLACPAGTFNSLTQKDALSDCLNCTSKFYCADAATVTPTLKCPAGYYCPGGSSTGVENICPIGSKCPLGQDQPIACSGTTEYQDEQGKSTCKTCVSGYYCNNTHIIKCQPQKEYISYYCPGSTNRNKQLCPPGTFTNKDGAASLADCVHCPPGKYCPNDVSTQRKIIDCPEGYYCLRGTYTNYTLCPVGFYCPLGTNAPIPCKAGMYCDQQGLSAPVGNCSAGYYCTYESFNVAAILGGKKICVDFISGTNCYRGSTSSTQNLCPIGAFCPAGSDTATLCPIGTYQNKTGMTSVSDCTKCEKGQSCPHRGMTSPSTNCSSGYYCPEGSTSDQPVGNECQPGYYCPQGVSQQIQCPIDSYQPFKMKASCLQCPISYYCPNTGMDVPMICPKGYFCNGSPSTLKKCPAGQFSDIEGLNSSSQCQFCLNGQYCSNEAQVTPTGNCQAGYYCYVNNLILITQQNPQSTICPKGSYCPSGSILPIKCPPGTYNDQQGSIDINACIKCEAGYICDKYGMQSKSEFKSCPEGYYCLEGAKGIQTLGVNVFICPKGYFCKSGSNDKTQCPIGSYNPTEGQSACLACQEGYTCDQTGTTVPDDCPKGNYCPVGSLTLIPSTSNKKICPAGTFNSLTNLKAETECQICPKGRYCVAGETNPEGSGPCNAGFLCDNGAKSANDTSKKCPTGHYCEKGALYPKQCPEGTEQKLEGAVDISYCIPCPEGNYTDKKGTTNCSRCMNGFYCIKGSTTPKPTDGTMGRLCDANHYCISGLEYKCSSFSYQNIKGQSSCQSCPIGYNCNVSYNLGQADPPLCEKGYFCNKGYQEICPIGTYGNSVGLEYDHQCTPCPTGYYCKNGRYDINQTCDAGFFCKSGAKSNNDTNNYCPAGFYCEQSATQMPIKCPNGTFSLAGASSVDNCTECQEGYYCMDGSAEKFDCPEGSYCPPGTGNPVPCPKGTYGGKKNLKREYDCSTCPSGSLCNTTGIENPSDFLCPPGYYCIRGSLEPVACPVGYYRAFRGGSSINSCLRCDPGFYCANEAQVVPIVCPNGTYCPSGTQSPIGCPAGYYCPSKSSTPIKCPTGFYCPGRTEFYFKCANGTYCPPGTSIPITCPGGKFGSGVANNTNETVSCDTCGRGQYSTQEMSGLCMDCTPGYVCLGSTNVERPTSIEVNNGYICPPGHYCPLASYREVACPIATYNKYEGRDDITDCLPCKAGYYNDIIGQSGCKQCGPSSSSAEGSSTCSCIGKNRRFAKSIGACLCESGFKPKDGKSDSDSIVDCEANNKQTCADGQEIDLEGYCVDSEDSICKAQCDGSNGSIVSGTGLCSCSSLVVADQVCDATCRSKQPTATLDSSGNVVIYDPKTNKTQTTDPSTINGYVGDFKCQSANQSDCKVYSVGKSDSGDFTYDYSTNQEVLFAAGLRTSLRRQLQSTTSANVITNPVMCIKQGNAVLFSVNSYKQQYPVYYKDSILNTNQNFDYGPFLELQSSIQRGTVINAFSYIFKDAGIYVFKDSSDSNKYTILGVVASDQECSNKDANVQSTTAASLSSIGIVSQPKIVNPQWSFIIGVFVFILLFSFGIVTFIIVMHNRNSAQNIKSSDSNTKKNNIYYEKLNQMEKEDLRKTKWYYCLCKKFNDLANQAAKVQPTDSSGDVSYGDLEKLLAEFKESMDVLKQKMKEDGEKAESQEPQLDEEKNEEDVLIDELNQLRKFVNDNKECIEDFFGIKRDKRDDEEENDENDELNDSRDINDLDNPHDEMSDLLRDQQNQEQQMMNKMKENMNQLKEQLIIQIKDQGEDEKQKMIDDYKFKIDSMNLSEQEKIELLDELEHRLNKVNDILQSEEASQEKKLQDALAKRRKKKDELTKVMVTLNNLKQDDTKQFNEQIEKIAQKEKEEMALMEKDIEKEKNQEAKEIEKQLQANKSERLAEMERKLEEMKRNKESKDWDIEFGDLLNDYGKLVKNVEMEMEFEKAKQMKDLEERIRRRKEMKQRDVQEQRKEREQKFNEQLNDKSKNLGNQIEQIKQLLKPVVNEDLRIQALLDSEDIVRPLERSTDVTQDYRSNQSQAAPFQKQIELVAEEEDQKINNLLEDMKKQADRQNKDHELQKQTLLRKIEEATDSKEKQRLMDQFEKLRKNIDEIQNREAEEQNQKLRDALLNRKARKQKINSKVKEVQQESVLKQVDERTKELLDKNLQKESVEDDVKNMAEKLKSKFEKDELIQVAENFLDQKHLRDLQEYMLALFDERAKALRKYIFDLMTQKQTELELIKEEFQPQYDFLKDKKAKGLITDSQYRDMMAKLQEEESDKRIDAEIQIKELEQKMEEELMIQSVKNRADVEQALKDKQADEKVKMIDFLIGDNQNNETIKQYLEREKKGTLRELVDFKKQKDQEKQKKLKDIEEMRANREQELREKEERMLNWEDKMKQEEAKHMQAFEKQKNAIISKKLNEQKAELLREVNKDEISKLLQQHKRDIANLETALQKEQERQMTNMRKNVGERLKDQETGKIKREIKMAQLIKDKSARQKEMLNVSMASSQVKFGSNRAETKEEQMKKNIEKIKYMQQTVDKKVYFGGKLFVKDHQVKKMELIKKLLKKDDLSSIQQSLLEQQSNMIQSVARLQSQFSDDSLLQDSVSSYATGNLTFKELIDHVNKIEDNYQEISKNILNRPSIHTNE
ncbi:gcc2 and gcc3 domain-containing protein [Stylonychia lemnae]|uniref:Gcc2 and gcc3 domain-containing protein n=1 Tax=Stylonychia lemnae TaxID=5949 RepID=A0A077ZQW7_STYLE|nr:gcc2 and gcc3 domain-containing protein [Stylonychia lemnae]|eukprot:CDW71824.1 gcc2 and gcc3 domain-containing protein [Stylonychia lemnae]